MNGRSSRPSLAVAAIGGFALLAVGGVLALRPALLLDRAPGLVSLLERVDPGPAVAGIAAVLGLGVVTVAVRNRLSGSAPPPLVDGAAVSDTDSGDASHPGTEGRQGTPVAGADLDVRIERATDYDRVSREAREAERTAVVETLRPIAADAYARRKGLEREAAADAVTAGAWTDDPRAAAFLADEDGPSTPLSLWLFDLLTAADPFGRALDRTIAEIGSLQTRPAGTANGTAEVDP